MKKNNQKGVSLLFTLLIMAALSAITIGVARLSLGEIKLIRDIPDSLIAYYATDSGIERALYEERTSGDAANQADCSISLDNGSSYGLEISSGGGLITIKSTGCYKNIRRAIEVSF